MEVLKYRILPTGEIMSLKDFGDVQAGTIGGIVETEYNLSQRGTCWVYPGASATGPFTVWGSARILEGSYHQEAIVYRGNIRSPKDLEGNSLRIP